MSHVLLRRSCQLLGARFKRFMSKVKELSLEAQYDLFMSFFFDREKNMANTICDRSSTLPNTTTYVPNQVKFIYIKYTTTFQLSNNLTSLYRCHTRTCAYFMYDYVYILRPWTETILRGCFSLIKICLCHKNKICSHH